MKRLLVAAAGIPLGLVFAVEGGLPLLPTIVVVALVLALYTGPRPGGR